MKRLALLTCVALACVALAGCGQQWRRAEGGAWNTVYHIAYRCDLDLQDSITAILNQVDASLSPFNSRSLVAALNRGDDVVADSLLRRVMAESAHVNTLSGGYFDPTVAPLVNLYGFGPEGEKHQAPSSSQVDSARALVGISGCRVLADGRVEKKHPGTQFNFSAIAKGYGCDLVAEMLRRNGCTDYMVEIGGEIALSGANPRGEDWRIQVDAPVESDTVSHDRLTVIEPQALPDGAGSRGARRGVATSGNYRNHHTLDDGTRVAHTINPLTGRPAQSATLSATVVAPDCITADALATACMAMPLPRALAMIRAIPDTWALLVVADGDAFRVVDTRDGQ